MVGIVMWKRFFKIRHSIWTSRWYRGEKEPSPMHLEFGIQTHVHSKSVFTGGFLVEYKRLTDLPNQAVDRKNASIQGNGKSTIQS